MKVTRKGVTLELEAGEAAMLKNSVGILTGIFNGFVKKGRVDDDYFRMWDVVDASCASRLRDFCERLCDSL